MARIAGIDLPKEKRIEIGLTYIYGIGRTSANKILAEAGINPDTRVKDLTEEDEAKLREIIGHSYRGGRPAPQRGDGHQAADRDRLLPWHPPPQGPACPRPAIKTNARTRKGPKRTVANKKK